MVQYQVRSAENGYIFQGAYGGEQVFKTLDELLNHLLLMFEGRCEHFNGDSWGRVAIERSRPTKRILDGANVPNAGVSASSESK